MTDYNPNNPAYIKLKRDSKCVICNQIIPQGSNAFYFSKPHYATYHYKCGKPEWSAAGTNFANRRNAAMAQKNFRKVPGLEIRLAIMHHMYQHYYVSFADLFHLVIKDNTTLSDLHGALSYLSARNLIAQNDFDNKKQGAPYYSITPLGNHYDLRSETNIFPNYPSGHPMNENASEDAKEENLNKLTDLDTV